MNWVATVAESKEVIVWRELHNTDALLGCGCQLLIRDGLSRDNLEIRSLNTAEIRSCTTQFFLFLLFETALD